MKKIVVQSLLFIGALMCGSTANMTLIEISGHVIPPPPGANLSTAEGIRAALPILEARHFLFPFLAHALGTLVAAFLVTRFSATGQLIKAMAMGLIFLTGGIAAACMIPAPTWFIVVDLTVAYLPMGYLGYRFGKK